MATKKKPKKKTSTEEILVQLLSQKQFPSLDDEIDYAILKKRIVLLHGEVNHHSAEEIVRKLIYLSEEKEPIVILINSVGGNVYDGLLIYNTIKDIADSGIAITCEAKGECASMGAIILQAGTERYASRASRFLLHEIAMITGGKKTELEDDVKELKKLNDLLRDIIADRTGHKREEIDKIWKRKDVWFSAEEALEFRLIDKIVD